jgi:hypothetical protein
MILVFAGLIVLCVVLWYLISFLLSLMSVPVFLGILAVLLVLGRFTLPVLFDVLVPDRKWEREKRKRLRRPKQQRYTIVRDAGSVAFLAHLPRGDELGRIPSNTASRSPPKYSSSWRFRV